MNLHRRCVLATCCNSVFSVSGCRTEASQEGTLSWTVLFSLKFSAVPPEARSEFRAALASRPCHQSAIDPDINLLRDAAHRSIGKHNVNNSRVPTAESRKGLCSSIDRNRAMANRSQPRILCVWNRPHPERHINKADVLPSSPSHASLWLDQRATRVETCPLHHGSCAAQGQFV